MRKIARHILKSYLYLNIHIGLCAAFFSIQYSNAFDTVKGLSMFDYFGFVFSSTVTLYCIHRYIGYHKLKKRGSVSGRYLEIERLISVYPIFVIVFGLFSLYFISQVGLGSLPILFIPIILSGLYVLPIFPNGRRLRDYNFIKVFIIAITWVWFSIWYLNVEDIVLHSIVILESFLFMVGITIPFDIRDEVIDSSDGVKTLVTKYGFNTSSLISTYCLVLSLILFLYILIEFAEIWYAFVFYISFYLFTIGLVTNKNSYKNDLILTGFADGSLLLKGLLGITILNQI